MTDSDTTLARIDDVLSTCICGARLTKQGASLDYCSEDCQEEWQRGGRPWEGFKLAPIAEGEDELRPGVAPWSATIPVVYDFIDRDAINNLTSGFDQDDPRATTADDINRIQDEVWGSLLVSIHGSTIDDANGDIEDGSEVFIGFDVTGDTITWAAVSGNNTWRTGSFPIPADADQETLAAMGQVVVKGRWSTQPTDRSTT